MKYYTDDQLKHITDNGKYKRSDDEDYAMRVFEKSNYDNIEYRIGNAKASFYTMIINHRITYKEANKFIISLFYLKGITKADISFMIMAIEGSIHDPVADGLDISTN